MATKEIPLTKGFVTIVDEEDYDWLMQWKWGWDGRGYAYRKQHLGYFHGKQKQKTIRMHRAIMKIGNGEILDHINGNGLDNRRCNLRLCTQSQNHMNQRKTRGNSKYKGVNWHKKSKKWQVNIMSQGISVYLGCYDSENDAALAYNKAAKKLHKKFANLNVIRNL